VTPKLALLVCLRLIQGFWSTPRCCGCGLPYAAPTPDSLGSQPKGQPGGILSTLMIGIPVDGIRDSDFLYGFSVISFGNFHGTCLQFDGFQSIFPSSRRETMKSQVLQKSIPRHSEGNPQFSVPESSH